MEPEAASSGSEGGSPPGTSGGAYTPPVLDHIPALGLVAALAALTDLILRRGVLRTVSGHLERSDALFYSRVLDLPLNLSAVASLVAIAAGLFALLSARLTPPWVETSGVEKLGGGMLRALTAALAGVFLPSLFIATFFPLERATTIGVFTTAVVAYLLVLETASIGARFAGPVTLRVAVMLAATATFGGIASIVLEQLSAGFRWTWAAEAHRVIGAAGELAFLVLPLFVLPRVIPPNPTRTTAIGAVVGTTLALMAMLIFEVWRTQVGDAFPALLYGALHVELFLDSAPMLYAGPIGLYLGLGLGALCSRRPAARQLGAALLLLLAAGYGPRSPGQLAMLVLGMTLLCRATVALGLRDRYALA